MERRTFTRPSPGALSRQKLFYSKIDATQILSLWRMALIKDAVLSLPRIPPAAQDALAPLCFSGLNDSLGLRGCSLIGQLLGDRLSHDLLSQQFSLGEQL